MSYERYKDYRLAPDDNGCWDILNSDYDQKGTYPSKAAAKRAIDDMSLPRSTPQGGNTPGATPTPPESEIDAILLTYTFSPTIIKYLTAENKSEILERESFKEARAALSRLIEAEVRRVRLECMEYAKELATVNFNKTGFTLATVFSDRIKELRAELEAGSGEAKR